MDLIAAFRLFGKTLPIHFALLRRKRKYVKSKKTAKLKGKQTSIAAVRAKLGQIDAFQTPLLSHCRLPLKGQQREMVFWPNHSLLVWIERIWKFFEFGLLLTKVGRDFSHLALQENAPNMLMRLLLLHTMHFFLQARPKRTNPMCSLKATI